MIICLFILKVPICNKKDNKKKRKREKNQVKEEKKIITNYLGLFFDNQKVLHRY